MITEGVEDSWRFKLAVAVAVVLTAAAVVFSGGNPAAALAGPLLVGVAFVVVRMPLGVSLVAFFFAALLFDDPAENPGRGLFRTPFYKPGEFLYRALDSTLGIPGLKPFGIELALWLIGLLALIIFRLGPIGLRREGARVDERMKMASWIAVFTLGSLEVWGLMRGGVLRFALLQSRALLFCFLLPLIVAPFFKHRRYIHAVITSVILVTVVRSFMGIYYYATITSLRILGESGGGSGDYVLTHSDAVLGAISTTFCVAYLYHRFSARAFLLNLVALPPILIFMVFNNRRLAFVEVGFALLFIYFMADATRRRRVHITMALGAVLLVGYIGAGWNSGAAWARPIQTLKQVSSSSDSSSQTRDIENYNLTLTVGQSPILGSGFGHEYWEFVKAYDISQHFEAYLYVPHNSVLWLLSAAGVVGWTLIWWVLAVMVFLAVRIYRSPRAQEAEKMLAYWAVATSAIYGVQAFGDMGLQSWMSSIVLGLTVALVGVTAKRLEVWGPLTAGDGERGGGS